MAQDLEPRFQRVRENIRRGVTSRKDAIDYAGGILVRQRIINNGVVDFSKGLLPSNAQVLDGCAGPEGIALGAALLGYKLFGNNISANFAETLKKTGVNNASISDFSQLAYKNDRFDGVFLVFAINEFYALQEAFGEASRVLKPGGMFVVADSGPTHKDSATVIKSILTTPQGRISPYLSRFLRPQDLERINQRFSRSKYSIDDFVDYQLKFTYGITRAQASDYAQELIEEGSPNPSREYVDYLNYNYWHHVRDLILKSGFTLEKAGLGASYKNGNSTNPQITEWRVSDILAASIPQWIDELALARIGRNEKVSQTPFQNHFTSGISYPVLCFKKKLS